MAWWIASAARVLVEEGPARVEELLRWDTRFDRYATGARGELMLTREGAHSRNRILHANGDATGREIGRALLAHATATPGITLLPWTLLTDLLASDGRVSGALLLDENGESSDGACARGAAGERRRGPGLQRHHQSRSRHR